MVGTIRVLEEQLEDTRSAAESNQAKLLEEYHKVSRIRTDLISENSELKAQLKAATQTTTVPEMPKLNSAPINATRHRFPMGDVTAGKSSPNLVVLKSRIATAPVSLRPS